MLVVTALSGLSFSVGPAALLQPAAPGSPGCSASHSAAGRHGAATLAAHSEASSADGWRGGSGHRWLQQPAQSAAQSAAALLASAALLLGSASPGYAENELADLAQGQFKSELIDPQCFAKSCKLQTKACAENGDCMKGLTCAAKCMGDTQCTVGCFAKFGNPVLDDVLSCTIEDQSCLKIAIVAPGADGPLDAPLPPKPLVAVTPQQMAGKWYKVMGWNSNYDCYDCQRNSFRPAARQQAMAIAADGSAVDVDVEYSLPRQRAGMPQDFHAQLHEKLVFDTTPGSHRTAHTEGKMFGLTFWENWYVIGANDRGEDAFRIVYYTGKTLQNKYEGAFVYARKPDLPASAMPHIYSIARQAGLEPTSFCAIDNRCYAAPAATAGETPQPPPFTNVAAADTIELDEDPLPAPATPPPRMGVLRDAQEFLEDPRPFGRAIFEKQKKMSQIREFDADGRLLPSENFRSSGSR